MESLFTVLLVGHIIAGFTALTGGVVPMLTKKGGYWHNLFGRIYFWAMFGVFLTSVPLALLKNNLFLFTIGIFSFYFVLTGYRFARRKGFHRLTGFDRWVMRGTLLASVGMLGYAAYLYVNTTSQAWIILGVFGAISLRQTLKDLRRFGDPGEQNHWVREHLVRMGGGYIATFTAFTVTNLTFLPDLVSWLGPTVVGTIILFVASARARRRFNVG